MADDVQITAGTGTTIATEEVGGVHHQKVKVEFGGTDVATMVSGTNPLPVAGNTGSDVTMQNAVSATGNGTSLTVTGYSGALLVISGTFTAVVYLEVSSDGGSTWSATFGHSISGDYAAAAFDAPQHLYVPVAGHDLLRARVDWTSGTSVTVIGRPTNLERHLLATQNVAFPAIGEIGVITVPSYGVLMAGSQDGQNGNTRAVAVDADGRVEVAQLTSTRLNAQVSGPIAADLGVSSTKPLVVGGRAYATAPTDVSANNDVVYAWYLRNGAAATVLTAAGALIDGDASNGLDVDVTRVPADPFGANTDAASASGSISAKLRQIATNGIPVTNAGTFAVQDSEKITDNAGFTDGASKLLMSGYVFDETAGTALTENDAAASRIDSKRAQVMVIEDGATRGLRAGVVDETGASAVDASAVGGGTPHDSVNSGNPLLGGAEAIAHGTNPTAVAAADRTKLYANRAGVPFVMGGHPNIITIEYATTGTQDNVAIVTIGAGLKIVVTQIQLIADNANTAFPQVRVGFGATTTPTTTGVVLTHPGVPAGGGISRGDGSGILGVGADNEDLRITCGAPTGGSLRVLVSYYTIES